MENGRLGPYRLLRRLGRGGMGTVHLAEVVEPVAGLAPGELVALKVIHPHLQEEPSFLERFQREARVGRTVAHENVVRCYDGDACVVGGVTRHYLATEYVEGRTLRDLLEELGRVPEALCLHVALEMAKGLEAMHAAGVVHRDLKPENVLITSGHVVKIMDLGVAHLRDEAVRLSQTGAFVGSVEYAAPEQFRGRLADVDGRTDLYALGLILYELATGKHPYRYEDPRRVLNAALHETPPLPGGDEALTPFFEELVGVLVAKAREDRPSGATALREILEAGEAGAWWQARRRRRAARPGAPLPRRRTARETGLYGREGELELLRGLYERASAARGQVLLLQGEAGIGKTRLVEDFAETLRREDPAPLFLVGGCPPGGRGAAVAAFGEALRACFGTEEMEAALAEPLRETPMLVPTVAALLRGDAVPPDALPVGPDTLAGVLVRLLAWLASKQPVLLWIDDLHLTSDEGRTLFSAVARGLRLHRVLLLGTSRPGVPEAWIAGITTLEHGSRLELPRLGARDLARLLAEAFSSERLAEELSFRIAEKSDGNPYFVFEFVQGLRESKLIRRSETGTWIRTSVIRELEIPSSVHDLVSARLAEIDEDDRTLLDVAACWGHEFDPTLVGAACEVPRLPALTRFAKVERRHGLVRSAGRLYAFDHHLVREALYEAQNEQLREVYHELLAAELLRREQELSRDPADVPPETAVDLCRHALRGGQAARVSPYLERALNHLEAAYRNEEAADLCRRSLAANGLLAGRRRMEILLRLASRQELAGDREDQLATCREAHALALAEGDPALVLRVTGDLARAHLRTFDGTSMLAALDVAAPALAACDDLDLVARTHGLRGIAFRALGRFDEALRCYEQELALAREHDLVRAEAAVSGNLGRLYSTLGRYDEARPFYLRDLELSRERGDRMGEAASALNLGVDCYYQDRYDEARRYLEIGLEASRAIGWREGVDGAIGNLGNLALREGRLAEAREYYETQLRQAQDVGDRESEGVAVGNLGDVDRIEERWEAATARFAAAREIAEEVGSASGAVLASANLAQALVDSGPWEEAAPHLVTALRGARAASLRSELAFASYVLGQLRARQGRGEIARRAFRRSIRIYGETGEPYGRVRSTIGLVDLLLDEGRKEDAAAAWRAVAAEVETVRAFRLRRRIERVAARLAAAGLAV